MPAGETERSTDPASFVLELRRAFRYETAGSRVFDDPDTWVDTIAPYVTEDFTCVMNGGAMITEHSGVEGLRQGWTDFTAAFETIGIQPGELRRGADGELRAGGLDPEDPSPPIG